MLLADQWEGFTQASQLQGLAVTATNLGQVESQGISKAGQTVLARVMESQLWHQIAGSMVLCGEGLEKGQ